MDQIYKDRILLLADFLEQLPPKRFNFSTWVGYDWGGREDLLCGTTACGLGWATTIPEFRTLGLRLMKFDKPGAAPHPQLVDDPETEPSFAWASTCKATKHVFGLTIDETEYLFTPMSEEEELDEDNRDPDAQGEDGRLSEWASPKRLARHLREFVKART